MKGGESVDDIVCMGRVLKALRRARELSQIEIAYKADMNLSTYSRIERGEGNPTVKTVCRILETLCIPSEDYWELFALEKKHSMVDRRPSLSVTNKEI